MENCLQDFLGRNKRHHAAIACLPGPENLFFEISQKPFQQLVQRRTLFFAEAGNQTVLVFDVSAGRFLDNGKPRSVNDIRTLRRSFGLCMRSTSPAFSSWSMRLVMVPELTIAMASRSPGRAGRANRSAAMSPEHRKRRRKAHASAAPPPPLDRDGW